MTTPRGFYAWNHRELATLLTLRESLAEFEFGPLIVESMHKDLTSELSRRSTCCVTGRNSVVGPGKEDIANLRWKLRLGRFQ